MRIYNTMWSTFVRWCQTASIDPMGASALQVLEFLQDDLDRGLSHNTICLQVAALSTVLVGEGHLSQLSKGSSKGWLVSMQLLMLKVVFLIVITSARHISELGALCSRADLCVFHQKG